MKASLGMVLLRLWLQGCGVPAGVTAPRFGVPATQSINFVSLACGGCLPRSWLETLAGGARWPRAARNGPGLAQPSGMAAKFSWRPVYYSCHPDSRLHINTHFVYFVHVGALPTYISDLAPFAPTSKSKSLLRFRNSAKNPPNRKNLRRFPASIWPLSLMVCALSVVPAWPLPLASPPPPTLTGARSARVW